MSQPKQCPYIHWYKFHRCNIKSCKQYTEETEHRCLAVDRIKPEGTKAISDSEIHFYKYRKDNISTRLVQMRRKSASDRVKNLLILHAFIEYIRENGKSGSVFTLPSLLKLERHFPLRLKKLNWQNWMWEYVFDEAMWKSFVGNRKELADIEVSQLLNLQLAKFEHIVRDFNTGVAR